MFNCLTESVNFAGLMSSRIVLKMPWRPCRFFPLAYPGFCSGQDSKRQIWDFFFRKGPSRGVWGTEVPWRSPGAKPR